MSLNKDRLAGAIEKKGETKKKLEEKTGTIIHIDSESGKYRIEANEKAVPLEENEEFESPGLREYITNHILQAINYGFSPDKALTLLKGDKLLEIIDLEKTLSSSEKRLKRIKGRLIGREGKMRSSLEQMTGIILSVHGKFLAIIGDHDSMKVAKKAVNMILQGAPHKPVIDYLRREYQKQKQAEFREMWKPTL